MLITLINEGSYHDSVVLMLMTNRISELEGVNQVAIMMATPANKAIIKQAGMGSEELETAMPNDMVIAADVDDETIMTKITEALEELLAEQIKNVADNDDVRVVKSWESALDWLPDANLAVISTPGAYAAMEANRALDEGMNVFIFSDNVTLADEVRLKEKAHAKGLLVMGPDCGTGIINGVPIAFTNNVSPGGIGIIGASGTGIQELTTIIDRLGEGVTNAIGTGGRDLSSNVGGITMLDTIEAMDQDDSIEVCVVISKPPAKEIRDKIMSRLSCYSKPVVTLFLGEKPAYHEKNIYHAYTLDEAARLAVGLLRGQDISKDTVEADTSDFFKREDKKTIKAYYSGGTLASETAMLIRDALGLQTSPSCEAGYMLNHAGNVVIDLGDDFYTQGRPHPMIDPSKRIEFMGKALEDASTGVILFDVVLGYGSHEDMAGALVPKIKEMQATTEEQDRQIIFVATVCGTNKDFQGYESSVAKLEGAGVIVAKTNKLACETAIQAIGMQLEEANKSIRPLERVNVERRTASARVMRLLSEKPKVINVGLQSFAEVVKKFGSEIVHFDWRPPAGGNLELIKILDFLRSQDTVDIDAVNQLIMAKIVAAQPVIKDICRAKEVIPELNKGKVILHAGPPINYTDMPPTVQGSCIGAVLFEQWADDEEEAKALLGSGQIDFMPCHHVNAVGPMGGITTANMPVWVVVNETDGNEAYCTMNEGIGKVLRFGAYSQEVIDRLNWIRDVLAPTLSEAIRTMDNGLPINPIIAKALAMGDELHQRNIAASLIFYKEIGPIITNLDIDEEARYKVMKFLADTDQFFLNIMMAASKAIMDGARMINEGTIVTALCRNGIEFGVRIAGMGDEWFTGPVNIPQGLYFTGFNSHDGCPDIGDSAITETLGAGGVAMIAAPAVTRFVGAGGYQDALDTSNEMTEIFVSHNPNYSIPNWNFKGSCLGLDARLVVEKGITPVINTGIAHKMPGYGQIGAGTVHPPVSAFEKALVAYAEKLGYEHTS